MTGVITYQTRDKESCNAIKGGWGYGILPIKLPTKRARDQTLSDSFTAGKYESLFE